MADLVSDLPSRLADVQKRVLGRRRRHLRSLLQTGRHRAVERMTWRLEISHVTRYRYDHPVRASYNGARAR
jgi:hypothetical protein